MTTKLRTKGAIAWAGAWGLVLALFAGQALALGLGRIEVKSQRNQPLLAEIQVISSNPAELDQLQARLASPDTFARIGLEPPEGIVSDLQFSVALDERGNPVIRVTSRAPVQESLLTFLVEVDWGQGRLVREYSALVDAPNTVSAPAQPPVQAPVVAPTNTIVRPAETPVAEAGSEPAAPEQAADQAPDAPVESPAEPEGPDPDAVAASPVPAPPVPTAPTPAAASVAAQASATEYGPVQAGETLGEIAQVLVAEGLTREQAIVALYRANPQAFISDNLNLIRRGAVLRIPQGGERDQHSVAEARALVREHVAQWREMRQPAPQPEAVADATAPQDGGNEVAAGAGAAPRVADARLEIVPPSSGSGQQAGTRSGTAAGGEGEMLRQELQQELLQNKETLAARDAEVADLKARVADLERLQAQQQQLISLKDSDLAAAQARLAEGNAPAAATAATTRVDGATPPAQQAGSGLPWIWIGVVLLAAGLLAAWLLRRRKPAPKSPFDSAALAAATPKAGGREDRPAQQSVVAGSSARADDAVEAGVPSWNAPARASVSAPPVWHMEPEPEDPSTPRGDAPASPASAPEAAESDGVARVAPLNPAPAGVERIELARAYLDLGDTETARSLLQEVVDGGDAEARQEASQLLRGIA